MKYIVILGDGMADYPVDFFDGKTILEVAKKPTIDYMCAHGELGMVKTVQDGMKPGSDVANLSVMGYDTRECYSGRSPLEAASIGVEMKDDDVTFRTNLVTLSDEENYEDKTMLDYSAGEITTEEANELINAVAEELNTDKIKFYAGISYRHLCVWNGGSTNVDMTPPHDISDKKIADHLPKGDGADVFLEMMKKSEKILKEHPVNKARAAAGKNPATSIWPWGEGTKPQLENFEKKFGVKGSVISAVDLIKGIAKCAGMNSIDVEGATGNCETNWDGKAQAALDAILDGSDFVYLHMEAPDEMGHQGAPEKKKFAVETIDAKVVKFLKDELEKRGIDYKMLIMPDHPTPISLKTHVSDPVPYVIYDSTKELDTGLSYTEENGKKTSLYIEKGYTLMNHFLDK
ncbi:cofactor-independent phosphoglycerate mutase [Lachnospiraceae bacterium MD329]|nr:cofactor-independent phosphoglycerate mutase [Lachnospiraceae bacterium MD329]